MSIIVLCTNQKIVDSLEKTLERFDLDSVCNVHFGNGEYDAGSHVMTLPDAPMRVGALLDKIRHHQHAHTVREVIHINVYTLSRADIDLTHQNTGERIRLTEKERDILLYLYDAGGTVGREDLLTHVWGYVDGIETHTLETHIYRLRQKIEKDPANPKILVTNDDGYRIV